MQLGRIGIWTHYLDLLAAAEAQEAVAELQELGYRSVWIPETVTRDPLVHAGLLLAGSSSIVVATGIANIWARDAQAMAASQRTLAEAYPGRFLLGLGVSHRPLVERVRGHEYRRPLQAMRSYLEAMDGALVLSPEPAEEPRRVLGALGPRMLALAAEKADGAHPYNVTATHTATAREVLGPDALLLPEQAVVFDTDPTSARAAGRAHLANYLGLPNYFKTWFALGFDESDLADGGSDRLVDAMVAWGDEGAITARIREHLDAGADHVAVQVVQPSLTADPRADWRDLAPALTAL